MLADIDPDRARKAVEHANDRRLEAASVDASDRAAIAALARSSGAEYVLNACDPRFNEPIFFGCRDAGVNYLDMAMTLSHPHPDQPYELTGVKLGDVQFDVSDDWESAGLLALVGIGVEPGLADVFARHAADELFSQIDEIGVRDGANLEVEGYEFAPSFSIWTTIEECLNPPVVWEKERGWFTTPPFSEPEVFDFPEGIGPVECVNVEHEEVLLVPRYVDAGRVTFKYGLGNEFIEILKMLHTLGLDSTEPVSVRGTQVSPRDVVAACLPDPASLGPLMTRQDLRRHLGSRPRPQRRAAGGLPLPGRGQRAVHARVGPPVRRLADRATTRWPQWSCWPAASGRARASSGPRRSRPGPSSTCCRPTARRGGSAPGARPTSPGPSSSRPDSRPQEAAACSRYTRDMRGASARMTQQAAEILAGLPSPVQAFSGDGSVLPLRIGSRHSELIDAEAAATRARRGLWLVVRSDDHEIELEIARVEPKGAWMARIGLRVLDVRVRPLTRQSPRTRVSETAQVYVLGARSVTAGEHFDVSVADVSDTGLADGCRPRAASGRPAGGDDRGEPGAGATSGPRSQHPGHG